MLHRRLLLAVGCGLVLLAGRVSGQDTAAKKLYPQMLQATGWVRNFAGNEEGTGWVVDRAQRLMLTNWHVVVKTDAVTVYFPVVQGGKVVSERSFYQDTKNNAPAIRAQVIESDSKHDLALLQLDSLAREVGELKLAAQGVSPGDRVYTVGNPAPSGTGQPSDPLWVYTDGKVGSVARQQIIYSNVQQLDVEMLLTSASINPGDSGGSIVDRDGNVVGIISGSKAGKASAVSLGVELGEIKTFLDGARQWLNPRSAADFQKRALHYNSVGRFGAAIADFTQVLKTNPRDGNIYRNRAEAQLSQGAYAAAIADFGQALRLNPKDAVAYGDRGVSYGRLAEYDQAIADLTQCLALSPNLGIAYRFRGTYYRIQSNYDMALDDLNNAIRLTPNDVEAYFQRGLAFEGQGNLDSAVADLDKAIQLQPKSDNALVHRGDVWLKKGDAAKALADYTAAIQANPSSTPGYSLRAELESRQGQPDKALADWSSADQDRSPPTARPTASAATSTR